MSGNKDDWISFIEKEDGEMFAVNLVEDIIKNSRRVLFEKQIDAQILPYTVNYAKNLLMDMVNYYYFQRDPGNVDESLWIPDEEPECVLIDSWAPAAVPIRKPPVLKIPKASPARRESIKVNSNFQSQDFGENLDSVSACQGVVPRGRNESISSKTAGSKAQKLMNGSTSSLNTKKKGTLANYVKPSSTKVEAFDPEKSISDDNKKFLAKISTPAAAEEVKTDYTYDHNGKIIAVNQSLTWQHTQDVKYKISNRSYAKREESRTSITNNTTKKSSPRKAYVAASTKATQAKKLKAAEQQSANEEAEILLGYENDPKLTIPLLADTMRLVPGVTLREYDVEKTVAPIKNDKIQGPKDIGQEKNQFELSQINVLEEIISNSKPVSRA